MLEKCAKKIYWQKIAQGLKPVARVWSASPGGWIALGVLIIFGALIFHKHLNRDDRRREIAAAFGAANTFYSAPQMSHDGRRFTYVATTKVNACSLYLCDISAKRQEEIACELPDFAPWNTAYDLRAWAWSPDDSAFVYSMVDKLVIYPANPNAKPVELTVQKNPFEDRPIPVVSQLVWLAPERFVFVEKENILCLAQKQTDGQWQKRKRFCGGDISSLTVVATNMVAWLQNGLICRLNFDENPGATYQEQLATNSVPNLTISWSCNAWGFHNALKNSGLPVPNTSAGLALAANWNDTWAENSSEVQPGGITVNNLFDNQGNMTSANITYAAWNRASIIERHLGPDADGSYNREMLNGFLNAGPVAGESSITNSHVALTGIPYANYDVVIYFSSETSDRHGGISDGAANYYFSTLGAAAVSGGNALFLPATQTNCTQFPGADFAFFPGLTNSSQSFACYPLSGMNQWLGISAVQVIQASNVYVLQEPHPARQIVSTGQPASFSVMAGGLNPGYQWRHAGTNLLGATNATYNITSAVVENGGNYDVIVANGFSSVTGGIATLTFDSSKTIQPVEIGSTRDAASTKLTRNNRVSKTKHTKTDNSFLVLTSNDHTAVPTNGLTLWLDAATLAQADQTPVTTLADLSPQKNDVVPNQNPPAYNAPTNSRSLQGKGTIHFTSANSLTNATGLKSMRRLGLTNTMPRTVFAVLRRDAGHPMMAVNIGEAGGHGTYFGIYDQADALYLPGGWDYLDNKAEPSSANWNTLEVVYDGTSQKGYLNGVLKRATTFQLNTVDKEVEIGLRTGKDAAGADGDFAELLIYDRALNTAERQQVEGYLAEKWFAGRIVIAPNPLVWVDPEMTGITGFSYSKSTGQLLISIKNGPDTTLWRYDFSTPMSRLLRANLIQDAQWVGPNEFAYIGNKSGHNHLVLVDGSGTEKARLFEHGNIGWFNLASAGGKLLFSGTVSNEPAKGIWQYDLETGQLQSLVAYSDHPFSEAKSITTFRSYINWPDVSCLIYPPPTVDPHKKYPLVIADSMSGGGIQGPVFQSAIAACGAYVVIVERPYWFGGIEQWGGNVMKVYQNLKLDPAIDPQQVYLYGVSAETHYMSELVEKTPGLWKGIILLNPSGLPDFSKSPRFQRRPKVLMFAADNENQSERFKQFQANALKDGVLVKYIIAPNEAHEFTGKAAKLERAEAVEHFIFEE